MCLSFLYVTPTLDMVSLKATILNGWWVIAPWMFHPIEHQYQVSRLSLTWILNEG